MNRHLNIIPKAGAPIEKPDHFIGRDDIIYHLKNNTQNISILGERRMGKTSLLLYFSNLKIYKKLTGSNHQIPVFFDFQGMATDSKETVYRKLMNAVIDSIENAHSKGKILAKDFYNRFDSCIKNRKMSRKEAFLDTLSLIARYAIIIHFFFDEFEQTAINPELGDPFYSTLRALYKPGKLLFTIATRISLSELETKNTKYSSPFFNIFTKLQLYPFSENDIKKMIALYFKTSQIIEDLNSCLPTLRDLTGYHPFLFQTLCYHIAQSFKNDSYVSIQQSIDLAMESFENDIIDHFDYYWKISSPDEKSYIQLLASHEGLPKQNNKAIEKKLFDRGLIIERGENYQLVSSVFQKWINTNHNQNPIYPGCNYHSKFYVHRYLEEKRAFKYLKHPGKPVVIWGPRKIGKTMFLEYLLEHLNKENAFDAQVRVDLRTFSTDVFQAGDSFFFELANIIIRDVNGRQLWLNEAWKKMTMVGSKIFFLMEKYILKENEIFLLVFENADVIWDYEIKNDFFDMLRSWADEVEGPWKNLRLILTMSAPPKLLTENQNKAPFNLCEPIELKDFSNNQLKYLGQLYGISLHCGPFFYENITQYIGGHPYLFALIINHFQKQKQPLSKGLTENLINEALNDWLNELINNQTKKELERIKNNEYKFEFLKEDTKTKLVLKLKRKGLIMKDDNDSYKLRYKIYQSRINKE